MRALALLSLLLVVPATDAPTKPRLVVLMDCSGSMGREGLAQAVDGFREIAGGPTDQLDLAVIAWGASVTQYGEWHKLPDAEALAGAEAWLLSRPPGAVTRLSPALHRAQRMGPCMVLVVTDGELDDEREALAVAKQRPKGCVIGVLGIGPERKLLRQLGEVGGGGYYRVGGE